MTVMQQIIVLTSALPMRLMKQQNLVAPKLLAMMTLPGAEQITFLSLKVPTTHCWWK
jgi:hypothetical protein